jgi:hypothetical protein
MCKAQVPDETGQDLQLLMDRPNPINATTPPAIIFFRLMTYA